MYICEILCLFHHHSNIAADQMLYTEKDLEKSMDKIETVNFHQVCGGVVMLPKQCVVLLYVICICYIAICITKNKLQV